MLFLKIFFGAIIAALVLFLAFLAVGITIIFFRLLFAPKPEHEIVSTGNTFADAARMGKYFKSRSNFLLSHDGDLGRARAASFEAGKSPYLCVLLRVAHLYGYRVKVKEVVR